MFQIHCYHDIPQTVHCRNIVKLLFEYQTKSYTYCRYIVLLFEYKECRLLGCELITEYPQKIIEVRMFPAEKTFDFSQLCHLEISENAGIFLIFIKPSTFRKSK